MIKRLQWDKSLSVRAPLAKKGLAFMTFFGGIRLGMCVSILLTTSLVSGQAAQSVLRNGTWLKIGVTQTGVYKIDYATLLKANPAFGSADPRQFRLFGNGGAALPQPNATTRPTDLIENAIQVTGEADGRFDPTDAVIFFGQGPTTIQYTTSAAKPTLAHALNLYSDTTFYFLTVGPTTGLRQTTRLAGNTTAANPITSYDEYVFREQESFKPIPSGRAWLGDDFQSDLTQSQSFVFTVPGRILNTPVRIRSAVMASSTAQTTFSFQLNGQIMGTQTVAPVADVISRYTTSGILDTTTFTPTPATADDALSIKMAFDRNGGAGSVGYLDFISVQLQREIRQYNQPIWIRTTAGAFAAKQATSALRIWDISNPLRPVQQAYSLTGTTGAWSSDSLLRHDYYLFTDAQMQIPASISRISNQNLHAQPTPNLIIVTPAAWRTEAERLATFRRTNDNLSVLVVTTQEVYNEFASGQPDPTAIRDMCRYFFRQTPQTLRYLLLLGDATFDYRNKRKLLSPTDQANTIPVYESRESMHPILSFSSDDYFGFLKDSDGEWAESDAGDQLLDIGVGRLPAKSPAEAKIVVDKLIAYSSDKTIVGDWQSKILFVADDGDDNLHQKDANQLATYVEMQVPTYHPDRVFLDTFQQITATVGGTVVELAPEVNQLIDRDVQDGRLIVNYTGHGGVSGWSQEQILTLQDILSFKNRRLPLFVTATCEFGRYDDPVTNSGAELALLNANGGAIGLLTTTRPVFADKNLLLNQAFYRAVFRTKAGQVLRLGNIMQSTKDSSLAGVLNRNFALLGDPSMALAYPRAQIAITQLNGRPVGGQPADTLKALQRVQVAGEIRSGVDNQLLSNFSGLARLTLYDKPTSFTTNGTESSAQYVFTSYTSILYSGQVAVQNGRFAASFVLPKDIDPTVGLGRLYAYAIRADSLLDAGGVADLRIGGVSNSLPIDTQPPVIRLTLADTTAGQPNLTVAGPDVTLLIDLSDNVGINLSQRVPDHALSLQLNQQTPVLISNYYVATTNDGRQGRVTYPFTGLANGSYIALVKAFDSSNNPAEATLNFVVSDKAPLAIQSVTAYPNPFQNQVSIDVRHNRPGETLDWILTVFDLAGRAISEQTGHCDSCPAILPTDGWNGMGETAAPMANGLYIYRLQLRSATSATATQSGKLVLIK